MWRIVCPLALFICTAPALGAEPPRFGLPLACTIGSDCWVQNYVDHDPAAGVKDYACGGASYDGHDGTDFRIAGTSAEVAVIASAGGVVKALRDGEPDHLMKTEADRAAVANRECGNGVVIDHGGGWETQYCHMRKGSLIVRKGDKVRAGQTLGKVGYSGMAAFPHVHLAIRKDGEELDPFGTPGATCGAASQPIWPADVRKGLPYTEGDIIALGFAPGAVTIEQADEGTLPTARPDGSWPALVVYLHAINLRKDDVLEISITGPEGFAATGEERLERNKAQYMLFTGKKRPARGWAPGRYEALITIGPAGKPRITRTLAAEF